MSYGLVGELDVVLSELGLELELELELELDESLLFVVVVLVALKRLVKEGKKLYAKQVERKRNVKCEPNQTNQNK